MALLIADASYMVFYTYYAILKFYKSYFNENPDIPNIMNSPLFTSKFRRMFRRKIIEIATDHGVPLTNVVFATDCDRESIWRRGVYPEYKASRAPKSEFNPRAFDFTFGSIIPALCEEHGMSTIKVARAEADDIAGVLHRYVRGIGDTKVVIITNDNDYIQLADPNTVITNLAREDVCARKCETLTPEEYLLCKVLCGDKSDNLPGAVPRCGMKTAEKLVRNKDKLDKAIKDNDAYKRFEMNRDLMDLARVPEEIKAEIIETFRGLQVLQPSTTVGDAAASSIHSHSSSVACT